MRSRPSYTQCALVRPLERGTAHQVGWIPSPAARVGKVLRLRGPAGWQDGWIVEAVYQTQPAEVVAILERLHTRSRRYTDI
jgi:hypothetical protein